MKLPPEVLVNAEEVSRHFVAEIKKTAGKSWDEFARY
jgi:hypothetical protein